MQTFLGLDIGTSGAKCVLIDASARLLAAGRLCVLTRARVGPSKTLRSGCGPPRPPLAGCCAKAVPTRARWRGWAAGRPDALAGVPGGRPNRAAPGHFVGRYALGASGGAPDADWPRAAGAVGWQPAGGRVHAGQLAWLQENEPAAAAHTHTLLLPKDYLRLRLTGQLGTEASNALSTLLFDPHTWQWSAPLLAAAGLRRNSCRWCTLPPPWRVAAAPVCRGLRAAGGAAGGLRPVRTRPARPWARGWRSRAS